MPFSAAKAPYTKAPNCLRQRVSVIWRSIVTVALLLREGFQEPRPEAAQDHELLGRERARVLFRRFDDESGIEGEQRRGGAHIAIERLRHQPFDQSALFADAATPAVLA